MGEVSWLLPVQPTGKSRGKRSGMAVPMVVEMTRAVAVRMSEVFMLTVYQVDWCGDRLQNVGLDCGW